MNTCWMWKRRLVFITGFKLTSKHTYGAKKSINAIYAITFNKTKYDYTENIATRAEYIPKLEQKKDEMA